VSPFGIAKEEVVEDPTVEEETEAFVPAFPVARSYRLNSLGSLWRELDAPRFYLTARAFQSVGRNGFGRISPRIFPYAKAKVLKTAPMVQ